MLMMSRHVGESFRVGEDVVVTVMEIRGNKVRLGIVAPRGVKLYREEVWLRIQQERDDAEGQQADSPEDYEPDADFQA
jgi:carbon storage regulator